MPKPLIETARLGAGQPMNRAPFARSSGGESWYRINATDGDDASDAVDVYLYEEIGYWGITANDFVRDLNEVTAATINLHINSPGGGVFEGVAIYNALVQHKARVVVHIDGWAASIASVIAMAGDEIRIGESAVIMIHRPWSFAWGDADAMRTEADLLDKLQGAIIDIYEARTDRVRAEIEEWVNAETWFTGQEAVDAGFAGVCVPNKKKEKPAARLDGAFYAATFKHLPNDVRATLRGGMQAEDARASLPEKIQSKRDVRRVLSAYGMPRRAADDLANHFRPAGDARDEPSQTDHPQPEPRDEDGRAAEHAAALQRAATFIRSLSKR